MFSFFAMALFSIFQRGDPYTWGGYGPVRILAMAMYNIEWLFEEGGLDAPWLLNLIASILVIGGGVLTRAFIEEILSNSGVIESNISWHQNAMVPLWPEPYTVS